jgi:magnesium transporter
VKKKRKEKKEKNKKERERKPRQLCTKTRISKILLEHLETKPSDEVLEKLSKDIEQFATTDICQRVGVTRVGCTRPYLATSLWRHVGSRMPWLAFLLFAALGAGALVSHYEQSFMKEPILVAFIPMIMGIAGAGGSQSSTVIIRALAVGEITTKQYMRAFAREAIISLVCGVLSGLLVFVFALAVYQNLLLGLTLWLGLFATIVFAKLLGLWLPILAKKCRIDPALISSPLVTIIADIFGIFAYFTFAMLLLGV